MLEKLGCCFHCTRPYHCAAECKNARRLMSELQGAPLEAPLGDPDWKRPSHEKLKAVSSSATEPISPQKTAFLQTVHMWAKVTANKHLVRLLLDGGSQRAFLTGTLSRKLRTKVLAEGQASGTCFTAVGTTKEHN